MAQASTKEELECYQHAQDHVAFLLENSPLYSHLFQNIKVASASSTSVICTLALEPHHLNSKGSFHGSSSAALVDFMGGLAIACYDQRQNTGVSTDMHISFIGGAKTGDTLEAEGRIDKCGGTLAFTQITIRKLEVGKPQGQGALVTTGSHTKFVKQR